jgi:two-component system sensor histidine kinase DesK
MRLLPKDIDNGWAPYVWLCYLVFFWIDPILSHAGWRVFTATAFGTAAFLVMYFTFYWIICEWQALLLLGGMLAIGVGFAPFNGGACTFFIFAACMLPFVIEKETHVLRYLALVLAVAVVEWRVVHLSGWFLFYSCGLASVACFSNMYFAQKNRAMKKLSQAQAEVEHLAKVAERERIARDLHDVLGHTLSIIILKSELAGKLIDRDPARAKAEMADVEQTSRAALADVRSTIRGYRAHSLEAEIKQAKSVLETAGVSVQAESVQLPLSPAQESVVALMLREAVTNVVRHADARNCQLRLARIDGTCLLEIADDGRGGTQIEGNGLRGMRERVEALGGTLRRETASGTRLSIEFPVAELQAGGTA